jgi:hypothetical protein
MRDPMTPALAISITVAVLVVCWLFARWYDAGEAAVRRDLDARVTRAVEEYDRTHGDA